MKIKFKKGWISMDKDGTWTWWSSKPVIEKDYWINPNFTNYTGIYPQKLVCIELPKAKNWKESLMEV